MSKIRIEIEDTHNGMKLVCDPSMETLRKKHKFGGGLSNAESLAFIVISEILQDAKRLNANDAEKRIITDI